MFQNVLGDPLSQAAAIAFAKSTAFSLIVVVSLSIAIRRGVFGRRSSSRTFLYSIAMGTLIALGLAGFNQAAGLRERLGAPRCFPVDSQIVQSYFAAAALLTIAFLLVQLVMSLRASAPSQTDALAEVGYQDTARLNVRITLPRLAGYFCVGALVVLGGVTSIQWWVAKPFYNVNCIRAEVLMPDALQMWRTIHDKSPTDFDRLTKHLAEYVTTPGTQQAVINRAVDQTLTGYLSEFAPYLGALPDNLAIDYLIRRSVIAESLPTSYCISFFAAGTDAKKVAEGETRRPETDDFMSKNLDLLFGLKQSAAGKAMPAARAAKSDWPVLMRTMRAMGSKNANFDYIYERSLKDPNYCTEHAIFLRALAALDTPTAPEMRKAIVGSMLTGVQWNWVKRG